MREGSIGQFSSLHKPIKVLNCGTCGKKFTVPKKCGKRGRKYCSLKCEYESRLGRIPWNRGLMGVCLKPKTGWSITCVICGKGKYYQLWEHKRHERKYCSQECYWKSIKKDLLVKYSSIHARVRKQWGRAVRCEYCGVTNTIDWANLDGNYGLSRAGWAQLCRKHHIAYDKGSLNLVR